jgi:hypothetical protein
MGFDAASMLAGLFGAPAVPAAALVPEPAAALLDTAAEPAAGAFAEWVQAPDTRGRLGLQSPGASIPFSAWEDLPAWSGGTPADPAAGPCYWCGRREWWRSIHGAVVCGHCHPPAAPGLVAERPGPRKDGAPKKAVVGS